jgi:hypothetical protein
MDLSEFYSLADRGGAIATIRRALELDVNVLDTGRPPWVCRGYSSPGLAYR